MTSPKTHNISAKHEIAANDNLTPYINSSICLADAINMDM